MGCEVRRLRLPRGHFRGFQNVSLWAGSSQKTNIVLAHPIGFPVDGPWYLISNAAPTLDLVWIYSQRFCCERTHSDARTTGHPVNSEPVQPLTAAGSLLGSQHETA